jgi:uncharacterized membrane protein
LIDKVSSSSSGVQTRMQTLHSGAVAFGLFLAAPIIGAETLTTLQLVTACCLAASLVMNSALALLLATNQITEEMISTWRPFGIAQSVSIFLIYFGMVLTAYELHPLVAVVTFVTIFVGYLFSNAVDNKRKREQTSNLMRSETN